MYSYLWMAVYIHVMLSYFNFHFHASGKAAHFKLKLSQRSLTCETICTLGKNGPITYSRRS